MGDIAYWDDEFADKLKEVQELVGKMKQQTGAEKLKTVSACEQKLENLTATTRRSFNMELRMLTRESKQPYQTKLDAYDSQMQELRNELNWARKEAEGHQDARAALFGNRATAAAQEPKKVGRDEMLADTHEIQNKIDESLQRTLYSANEANEVADETLVKMAEQTEQMENIGKNLEEIQGELDKAKMIMTSFIKRAATDKLLMIFVLLIILAVLGLIIYLAVRKNF